jgi:hypothetical protein
MIDTIAARMHAAAGAKNVLAPTNAAEAALIEHLEIDWSYLEQLGVSEPEREREIRAFATAAWAAFGRQGDQSGAA